MRFNIIKLFFLTLFLASAIFINCERGARTPPKATMQDIKQVIAKENLNNEDYILLLEQTGLGRTALEDIKDTSANYQATLLDFQEQFFESSRYRCEYLFPVTNEEILAEKDDSIKKIKLAPLKDGDILLTKSTHTLGWRHGHAAIVIDAENEETLESVVLGQESALQELDKWRSYPTLLILRAKDEIAKKAVEFAKRSLIGVDYGPFVGMFNKNKAHMDKIDSTQCAHLVWQSFYAAGLDIDSDGWLVTPADIAACGELEVVQAYGFDPIKRQ